MGTCGTVESAITVHISIWIVLPVIYYHLGLLRDVAEQKMFAWAKRQQMHASSNSTT